MTADHRRTRAKRYHTRQTETRKTKRPEIQQNSLWCLSCFRCKAEPNSEFCAHCELDFAGR